MVASAVFITDLRIGPIFASVVEVHMNLSRIGMVELAQFEIDDDQAAQATMEEE